MSANADVLRGADAIGAVSREGVLPQVPDVRGVQSWNPEEFASEQIRCLVRRLFFVNHGRAVKQVVLSAAEPQLDISKICDSVALALARETRAHVALVDARHAASEPAFAAEPSRQNTSIKSASIQIRSNLWRVPKAAIEGSREEASSGLQLLPGLEELRKEFEYAILQGPAAGLSSETVMLGQLTDGIILVLGARSTRRASAKKTKDTLEAAQCRILGAVLMERTFPIPESIYRRL